MKGAKLFGNLQKYLLPALVLVFVGLVLLACNGRVQTRFPVLHPENGVLDVRKVDFDRNVYHIVNDWDYYPGALYGPEDFLDPDAAPEKRNDGPRDNHLGTWRLCIQAQPHSYLCLCSFSVDFSTRIFVNGKEQRSIGFVSTEKESAVPKNRYFTLPLYTGESGELELIYQYSNYWHEDGGFIQNTLISTPENIEEYQRGLALCSLLLSSGLLFLMIYFLLSASIQKSREYAALAFCCLVIALRNQFFFAEHLLPPDFNFFLEYRLVVLDVSLIPACGLGLLAAFYPKAAPRWTLPVFGATAFVLSILHFVLQIIDLVALCHVCYYVCAAFLVWFVFCMVRYFRKEQKPDRLDGLTLLALAFFISFLIWEGLNTGSNSSVNHFGVTPLAMVVCILLLAVVINSRIEQKTRLLRQAEERNELLSQINEMNKDFLRMVAHELKTPLTVISGYAQLIGLQLERSKLSEQTPERLRTIRNEADRLGEMVTRLMDYTYGGTADTRMGAVDADELLRGAQAVMVPVCAKRQNSLRLESGFSGKIHGNLELLLQVLINLIVNATRHSSESEITVSSADAGDYAAFTVTDRGSGIPSEIVPHIFEKGYTTTEGKGLGLAICRETVELHGGTLELVSTGPEGSCFRFTVPKERDA